MTQDELIERLIGASGTPSELAERAGVDQRSRTFQRALAQMVERGLLEVDGQTSDRFYRPPPTAQERADRELLSIVPCYAREFSDRCHQLGARGADVMKHKQRLGLVTRRHEHEDRWVTVRA